jgi:CRISPR-associated endonuclease Csn1
VYLACSYLLKHRGHFLFPVDKDNIEEITDFKRIFDDFYFALSELDENIPFEQYRTYFEEALRMNAPSSEKKKYLKEKLIGKKLSCKEDAVIRYDKLIDLISGATVKLSEIFGVDDYKDLEKNSICITKADFTETLEAFEGQLEPAHLELITKVKAMYEWSLLVDIRKDYKHISEAKRVIYEEHRKDLKNLKYIVTKYLSHDDYKKIFSDVSADNNYVRYVKNASGNKISSKKYEKCKNPEDFCGF